MRVLLCGTLFAALLLPMAALAASVAPVPDGLPAYVEHAMKAPARAADRKDDIRRQMAAILLFSQVQPGDKVLELMPGSGYWTRVFSQIVGSKGHVYQEWPTQAGKFSAKNIKLWKKLAKASHYANVSLLEQPAMQPKPPEQVDIVFTDDNYHDLHNAWAEPDIHAFNQHVYDALKLGGVFVVVDHIAPPGSGTKDTDTLHRIDPAAVKKAVEAVGFVFDGSSDVLLNRRDPLDISVFSPSIRGHSSQFIFRFRKPLQ